MADDADARRKLAWLRDVINRTFDNRDSITPSTKSCDSLKGLDIYKLSPGTNCRECGEATCLAFALKVASQAAEIAACRPLFSDPSESRRERLVEVRRDAGHEAPAALM